MADEFIDKLPIRKFFGVGKVTEEKMLSIGIKTGADVNPTSWSIRLYLMISV
jgi:DNA polymerase-4